MTEEYINKHHNSVVDARKMKKKREEFFSSNLSFPCKICKKDTQAKDFVINYIRSPWIEERIRRPYVCKECHKHRNYKKREFDRRSVEGAMKVIIKHIKIGAIKRGYAFDITSDDLLELWHRQAGRCYYTGYLMTYEFVGFNEGSLSQKTKYQVSCDRKNSEIGYTKDNVVLCTMIANTMKQRMSEIEFFEICKDIASYIGSR